MDNTKKPYKQAIDMRRVRIGEKYVLLKIDNGVVQLGADNDIIMNAMTVISTDYVAGTVTYHAFAVEAATVKLADLGIPVLEKGESWNNQLVTVKFGHAVKAVHKHINNLHMASRRATADEVSLPGERQLMELHRHA